MKWSLSDSSSRLYAVNRDAEDEEMGEFKDTLLHLAGLAKTPMRNTEHQRR